MSRYTWAGLLCASVPAYAVRLETHIPSAADAPCAAAMPFQDYRDTTRTCTMSWTLELSRQTHGFAIEPQVLGNYIERLCPGQEVLIQLWCPGRSSILLQERVRSAGRYLEEHLGRLGYLRDVHELCVAFDIGNHALDIILVPPTGGTWWILQDQVGREILRPVMRYYVDAARFRILTISPEGIGQAVCPSYQVRQSMPLPQGARGRVTRDHPEFEGGFCQGVLHIAVAAAASLRSRLWLMVGLLSAHAAIAAPTDGSSSLVPAQSSQPPLPVTMRIWAYNVRSPLDFPWKAEGYNTRWLHEYVCEAFHIGGRGIFLATGAPEDQVQHLLFVPRSVVAGPQPRYWLLHVEDRACVVPGQHPFDWDIVAQHIRDLFPNLRIPPTRPALGLQSQIFLPDYPLPEFVSGSVTQILLGALHMETSRDVWDPAPWAVPGPFFQFVPSRGPAGEVAQIYTPDTTGPGSLPAPPVSRCDVGCQTDVVLRVATHLLTHQTVQDLALQLHGLADCLQELPCTTSHLGNGSEAGTDEGPSASASAATASANPPPTAVESPEEVHSGVASYPVSHLMWCLCFAWPSYASSGPRLWCLLGQGFLLPPICHGSIFTPPRPESEEEEDSGRLLESEDDDENLLGDTPDGLRPGDGLHMRPAGPPPPLPAGSPPLPDPYGANLIANASAPQNENYLPGDWATSQVPRSPLPALVIRHVQWRLAGFQQCLLTADVFQDFPVPTGTPFRFHNPFTRRPQCEELRYSVTQGGSPWAAIESHVHNRGWRAVVLLNPQPDSQAVHLIAMPHDWHLVSVALVAGLRIVPCCVPRRSRFSDLLAVPLEDIQGRLELPLQVELDHGTVTLRSGDCFRVAVRGDPPEPVEVEPVPSQQTAAGSTEPAPVETSGCVSPGHSWSLLVQLLLWHPTPDASLFF